jgi:drug/metabolite transporter (DMT)-like permease
MRIGRGELETLAASLFFTAQILWLERKNFAECRVAHTTMIQFTVMSLVGLPAALITTRQPADWFTAYQTGPTAGMLAILVILCTIGANLMMNHWQRHVGATVAGLIYCSEPVFASALALVLPAWLSAWSGVNYPNERLTTNLLVGGSLILVANVLAHWKPKPTSVTK